MSLDTHHSTDTPTGIDVRPSTPTIGAEVVGVDLRSPLDAATVAEVREALHTHKVLFFRDQDLAPEQHIALGAQFGTLTEGHPLQESPEEYPEIMVVDTREARKVYGHVGERPRFAPPRLTASGWHTDITFVANPASASILRGVVIPPYGGDTLWTNLEAAYEDLSAPVRDLLDGLQAVHRWHGYDHRTKAGKGGRPSAVHPVVRVHPETGRRSLFVNPVFTQYLVGLSDRESSSLLRLLFDQIARPEFTVRFRWQPGSLAFWDNRSTAHLGPVDAAGTDFDRRVERVTLAGELPVGPDGFVSETLSGELFS
jgi:taurine dioxygenase